MKLLLLKLIRKTGGFIRKNVNPYLGFTDFFEFPFDTSKPMDESKGLDTLHQGCSIINSLGIKYTLATGTALGIYRENKFITNDTDLDVDIVDENISEKTLNKLIEKFTELGFTLGRKVIYQKKYQQIIFYTKDEIIFDMCIWRKSGNYYYNYLPELGKKLRKHPCIFYNQLSTIEFNNNKYNVPIDIENWLALQYGSDWKTPKAKNNWVEEALDLDANTNIGYNLHNKMNSFIDKY